MGAEEDQKQVFPPRPQTMEIAQNTIPTFPPAGFLNKERRPGGGRFAPASRLILQ
jgi:hypothetical protein